MQSDNSTAELKRPGPRVHDAEALTAALRAGRLALCGWELDGDRMWLSENASELLGIPASQVPRGLNALLALLPQEDREGLRVALQRPACAHTVTPPFRIAGLESRWFVMSGEFEWAADHRPLRFAGIVQEVTERILAEQRVQGQQSALLQLAKHEASPESSLSIALHRITEATARTLGVDRVSIWLSTPRRDAIHCLDLFEQGADRHSSGEELLASAYPRYFQALEQQRVIAAHDARFDLRTSEFCKDYLEPCDITSMLDATIRRGGTLVGVVCCENTAGVRHWTLDEQQFAGSIADLVSRLLERSELSRTREALQRNGDLLESIMDNTSTLIYAKDLEGRYLFVNRQFEALFGASREAIRGKTDYDIFPSDTAARYREHDRQVRSAVDTLEFEEEMPHRDGMHTYLAVKFPLRNARGEVYAVCGTATDITDLRNAHASLADSEARYRALFEAAGDAIFLLHEDRFIDCNTRTLEMFGCSREHIIGQPPYRFSPARQPDGRDSETKALDRISAAYDGERQSFEWEHLRLDGSPFSAEVTLNTLRLGGRPHLLALVRDVTERRLYLEALEHQASHDPLTDLPNRTALRSRLEDAIDLAGLSSTPFALLLMDLNRFKEINDTLGHHVGDEILVKIGPRLQPIMHRHSATLFRLGGDEFAILLPEAHDRASAEKLAAQILDALKQPFQLARFSLEIGASIGIAFFPDHGTDPTTLLRCADVAMYSCKRALLGQAIYSGDIDQHSPLRLTLMSEMGKAIEGQQLFLHYQPKIDLADDSVAGFEALVRWRHPEHGMIPPGEFIPVVEMTELIRPLTLWVLDEALCQLRQWRENGSKACIAVNLSARNLLDHSLVIEIEKRLNMYGVPADALELEITESTLMADPKRASAVLNALDALGVRLAIDDFGTGYSSLGYLRHLPVNALKIDRSFVAGMLESDKDEMIVRSTIDLAHNMGLQVIAEGIEDGAALDALREMRCDQAQGYFIGRPMPADEFDVSSLTSRSAD